MAEFDMLNFYDEILLNIRESEQKILAKINHKISEITK